MAHFTYLQFLTLKAPNFARIQAMSQVLEYIVQNLYCVNWYNFRINWVGSLGDIDIANLKTKFQESAQVG